jgi:hypothetical protein
MKIFDFVFFARDPYVLFFSTSLFLGKNPVFLYFPCVCSSVRVQTYVSHTRNNQERSTRILWNIASRMCGEGSEHMKSTKKSLCQNSVAYAKCP